ncbi:hypothetical protein, conserved [Plasmodium vivax]|nr:hypothetical protein, conserved [Plasmodium vivax]
MRRSATDNDLLYYEKYLNLKERFNNEYTKNDRINPDELLNDTEFNISNKIILRPVFVELLRHIRNNGVFMFDESQACSYVSYILSKEVQNKVHEYETKTFDVFQNFVNKYDKQSKINANICSTSLLYVNSEMYEQMNNLYVLYDEYKKLISNNLFGEKSSCLAANLFLSQYNEYIGKYQPTNEQYKKILDHFDNEIQRSIASYNLNACPERKFYIKKIELLTLPKDKKPEASFQVEQPPNHAQYQPFQARTPSPHIKVQESHAKYQAPRAESQTSPAESQTSPAESQTARVESQTAQEHPQTIHEGNQSSQETSAFGSHNAVQQQQRLPHEEAHQRELHVNSLPVYTPTYRSIESSETSPYSEQYIHSSVPPLGNEGGASSSSVMSTITNALKDVDPVPVVGVSGGMGALFLLFRYTPVGAFFRGGRRISNRIPSRFSGHFPGGYTGYEDFFDGNFGNGPINISYRPELE